MSTEELCRNIMRRMGEIESREVTKSKYRPLAPNEQDECPTGDTYNLLWDAVLDEVIAACPDIDVQKALGVLPEHRRPE